MAPIVPAITDSQTAIEAAIASSNAARVSQFQALLYEFSVGTTIDRIYSSGASTLTSNNLIPTPAADVTQIVDVVTQGSLTANSICADMLCT
jgi:hypothetical protein